MKKFIIATATLSFSLSFASPSSGQKEYLKEKHLKSYIKQCIEYWFYPEHNQGDLKTLAKSVRHSVKQSPDSYVWNWDTFSYDTQYSREYVEQLLRGAIIEHINTRSYSLAYALCGNAYMAQQITDLVDRELFGICSQSNILGQGVFAPFTGTYLEIYVRNLYDYVQYYYTPEPYYIIY